MPLVWNQQVRQLVMYYSTILIFTSQPADNDVDFFTIPANTDAIPTPDTLQPASAEGTRCLNITPKEKPVMIFG
jgi:hypothetical protein